ncbi:MAG: ParA family protein [Synergistaceae bacterium]|jgi:chromosome partitioning protein|nr:ParA family protein [Synergistaceae bacterium]
MPRIVAFANQKGGVGKTTCAINVGAGLAMAGRRVLLVDLDPQGSLTLGVGIEAGRLFATVHEMLKGECAAEDAIVRRGPYDVIPADLALSGAESELGAAPGRESLLGRALGPALGAYDYAILDCPPGLGLMTVNGLAAAGEVFAPAQAEFLSLSGLAQLAGAVEAVRRRLNPVLELAGVVVTMYDRRRRLNREAEESIRLRFPGKVFAAVIRDSVSLAEAPGHGRDIFEYRPSSRGAEDYAALCSEIIGREGRAVR